MQAFDNQVPQQKLGKQGASPRPYFFLKVYFARDIFFEVCFCVILQDIQSFFRPGISRISSGALSTNIWSSNFKD